MTIALRHPGGASVVLDSPKARQRWPLPLVCLYATIAGWMVGGAFVFAFFLLVRVRIGCPFG